MIKKTHYLLTSNEMLYNLFISIFYWKVAADVHNT